ncbi:STAS domain-containing protein [Thalassoglobus sp. JC818]|uniref:STAS domain-containing protein n=1 Tax=Thalassoglobus sp. JC818 TaxID=3232136 RepID=UPI00345ACE03
MTLNRSNFFDWKQDGKIHVVTLRVDMLTDEENLEQFDQELSSIVETSTPCHMVCDLSSVRYMSSSAIGKFISLHRKMMRTNGQLILCGLQSAVKDILATSHLLKYFHVTDDTSQAIKKLK